MRSHRLAVRTLASHAGNPGSIPGGITKDRAYIFSDVAFCGYMAPKMAKRPMFTLFRILKTAEGVSYGDLGKAFPGSISGKIVFPIPQVAVSRPDDRNGNRFFNLPCKPKVAENPFREARSRHQNFKGACDT